MLRCQGRIALARDPTVTSGNFYEVILGAKDNSYVSIEHTNDAGVTRVMDDELVPSLLDDAMYKHIPPQTITEPPLKRSCSATQQSA